MVAVVGKFQDFIDETDRTTLCLLLIAGTHPFAHLEKRKRDGIAADKQVAHVAGKSGHEVSTVETFLKHLVEENQTLRDLMGEKMVNEAEVILLAQHIKVLADILVG